MFNRIVAVCFANICRSPVAEYLLRNAAPNDKVEVKSAGIQARPNYAAAPEMIELMAEKGVDLSQHRSALLDQPLISWSELILVVEKEHQKFIEHQFPMARGRVQLLGKWTCGDIDDPYRRARENYAHCITELEEAVDAWAQKLWGKVRNGATCGQE